MAKRVEQKLYEAYLNGRSVRLTYNDVFSLVNPDDAIRARISNVAAEDAGQDEPVGDCIPVGFKDGLSWSDFGEAIG